MGSPREARTIATSANLGAAGLVVVFGGPSLTGRRDGGLDRLLAQVDLRPPAQRGDVLVALAARPAAIVLLDGCYYTVPAVTHKEILYALDAGVRVLGAASLGALRAAEMAPFGMEGAGRVFGWYRDGVLDGDDEVALLHGPAESGYRPLTVALVELRHALAGSVRRGRLTPGAAQALIAEVKRLPFAERWPESVAELARRAGCAAGWEQVRACLAAGGVKRADARRALALALAPRSPGAAAVRRAGGSSRRGPIVAGESSRRGPVHQARDPGRSDVGDRATAVSRAPEVPGAVGERAVTSFLSQFREWHLRPYRADGSPKAPTLWQAWCLVQVLHPRAAAFARSLRLRFLLAAAAAEAGLEAEPGLVTAGHRLLEEVEGRRDSGPLLPAREAEAEARHCAEADAAARSLGGVEGAARRLGAPLGLDPKRALAVLLDRLEAQADLMPPWLCARAFAFSAACEPAIEAATAALAVAEAFRVWSEGRRIAEEDLDHLAAGLWRCSPGAVPVEAARRGLFERRGAGGRRDALELLAPAERWRSKASGYPAARRALRAARLDHPLSLPRT